MLAGPARVASPVTKGNTDQTGRRYLHARNRKTFLPTRPQGRKGDHPVESGQRVGTCESQEGRLTE